MDAFRTVTAGLDDLVGLVVLVVFVVGANLLNKLGAKQQQKNSAPGTAPAPDSPQEELRKFIETLAGQKPPEPNRRAEAPDRPARRRQQPRRHAGKKAPPIRLQPETAVAPPLPPQVRPVTFQPAAPVAEIHGVESSYAAPPSLLQARKTRETQRGAVLSLVRRSVESENAVRTAVVLAEILGPPIALRHAAPDRSVAPAAPAHKA